MKITLKFFSSLMEYLPDSADGNAVELEVSAGVTARQALARFKVPDEEIQTVMKNGVFLPEDERDRPLDPGDVITVWPSIQGG